MIAKFHISISILISLLLLGNCTTRTLTQEAVKKSATESVPVQYQEKGIFNLGNNIFCSNNFAGARLNHVVLTDDTLVTVLISPENSPINTSPWYAFKLWSEAERKISLDITYPEGYYHRYHPKLSNNGQNWQEVDSTVYRITYNDQKRPVRGSISLIIGRDTLWVAAQELIATAQAEAWMDQIASRPYATKSVIGKSKAGKAIHALQTGERDSKQILMIISRQHPPEITGFKAMQAFVETINSDTEIARQFRKKFTTHVIPVVNPDGVDNGHWRHNNGGIDLNRDWVDFNQPETGVIRDYAKQKIDKENGKLVFFIDFHSTWKDIYYIPYEQEEGSETELVYKMIQLAGEEFPDYTPDVAKSLSAGNNAKVSSDGYFHKNYGAPALIYEVGDDTPREFIRKKAEVSAIKLMELLINSHAMSF